MVTLLTMQQTADQLGISIRTLREHVKHGEITYIAMGRGEQRQRRMFDQSDIDAFKERRRRIDACPSTPLKAHRSTTSPSSLGGSGFMAQLEALHAEKQKRSSERKTTDNLRR